MFNNIQGYKPNTPRKVYLDLQHTLHTPWEVNPDAGGVDIIMCKVTGQIGWRQDEEFADEQSAYCSRCMTLFDPGDECPQITVAGEEQNITVITFVR